jgi:phosphoribosyl 1,2-cyclic phosphodiesterase
MTIKFWGVRGSIACPGPDTVRYGGNTSCVEVCCGDHRMIFDAGSGLRALDEAGMGQSSEIDLFFSHLHIDHLIGLPFFSPAFEEGTRLRLWAGGLKDTGGLRAALDRYMSFPLFPIGLDEFRADIAFNDFSRGDVLTPRPGIVLRTIALDHPGGATGYRLEFGGRSFCYVTDTQMSASVSPAMLALVKGADCLVMDATYTDSELPKYAGWGHASWQQNVAFAESAGVKTLCLFHHAPEHDDNAMDRIADEAARMRPGTVVAREGLSIEI